MRDLPKEPDLWGYCDWCGHEIYLGDEISETTQGTIHDYCFNEMAEDIMQRINYRAGDA